MKFMHTSDWHLGAKLGNYSRLSEQREILKEIRGIAEHENIDFVILAGDIFDSFNPSNEATSLLYSELKKLAADGNRPVIVIAGNHDSPDKIQTTDPLATECGIFFVGYPDFVHTEKNINNIKFSFPEEGIMIINFPNGQEVNILVTPYANENRLRQCFGEKNKEQKLVELLSERWKFLAEKYFTKDKINVFVAHLFMSEAAAPPPFEPENERSILHPGGIEMLPCTAIPKLTQYAALGHLHRPQTLGGAECPIVYSGSPLSFGLSEENQQKSIIVADVEPAKTVSYKKIPLNSGRKIYRKQFENIDTAVLWLKENQNCYVELIIECDEFISAENRKKIYSIHDGITALIPLLKEENLASDSNNMHNNPPDLRNSIEELFKSFFKSEKGVPPNQDMLNLFRQILSQQENEDGES